MGLGGASARLFAREGTRVVVTNIQADLGRRTAEQIRDGGGNTFFHPLDVTSDTEWDEAVSAVVAKYGRQYVLLNRAGARGAAPAGLKNDEAMTVETWAARSSTCRRYWDL